MRFTTAAPLGSGATGEVLEAWDPKIERKIALKLLHRDNPEALKAMLREARAQAKVDHPNVGKVYEVGEMDGRPYIAMQLVEGRPLDEALSGRSVERKVGDFRSDLYHRIADWTVEIPPLRRRRSDIPNLVAHFLQTAALDVLLAYPWPGNVRQLEREMGRAALRRRAVSRRASRQSSRTRASALSSVTTAT